MGAPLRRKSAINANRMKKWLNIFPAYRYAITEQRIDRWLDQFAETDLELAAKTLDSVHFVANEQIAIGFRSSLRQIPGWHPDELQRKGKWRFVPFSISAGESADSMLHRFRVANQLTNKKYSNLFIYKSDLPKENLGPDDTVVFVDDFSGTGDQACQAWRENLAELLAGNPRTLLLLIRCCISARKRIERETDIIVVSEFELTEEDNIFSSKCRRFNNSEKERILTYCKKADTHNPKGYGDCGLLLVFAHACPNNSIPILRTDHSRWYGLFRR